MGIRDPLQKVRAVLVNYALHPTVLHADNTLVSADYPGYLKAVLEDRFPGSIALFAQGASGNQSTRYFRSAQTFEEAERVGRTLGDQAAKVLTGAHWMSRAALVVSSREARFIYRELPPVPDARQAVEKARNAVQQLEDARNSGKGGPDSALGLWNAKLRLFGAEDILAYAILEEKDSRPALAVDETEPEIQVLQIGPACLTCMPGELFVEYGLRIKRGSPFPYNFVITLANGGAPGYLYPREALEQGGYETDTSMLDPETGELFLRTALDQIRKIYEENEDEEG
jgi:hypothetical protein